MRSYLIILILLLTVASCNKNDVANPINFGYTYYPTEIGSWIIYDVDSIVFNDFTVPVSIDTYSYQVLEYYDTYVTDGVGDSVIRIEQSTRANDSASWQISHVATLKPGVANIQKVERDLRYVKLVFPPNSGKSWEGNLYIDVLDEPTLEYLDRNKYDWTHSISNAHENYSINNLNFDSTVTVTQIDAENLFEKKFGQEVYANHIGLIYKELLILETQEPPSALPFLERAEKGFILIYRINDYQM